MLKVIGTNDYIILIEVTILDCEHIVTSRNCFWRDDTCPDCGTPVNNPRRLVFQV